MDLTGIRLILLEDDRLIAKAFAMVMESWGCRVDLVHSLEDLSDLIARAEARPDVLIADYRLPGGKTGADAVALVRRSLGEAIPAIMITGDATVTPSLVGQGCLVLQKPVQPDQVRVAIEGILAGHA